MKDFNVMLAKAYDPKRVESWKEMYAEPKLDGVRVVVLVAKAGSMPRYYSRNGRELGMFTHLNPSIRKLCERLHREKMEGLKGGIMFDTEAVGMTFGDVSGAIHTKGTVALTCRLHVFHAMPIASWRAGIDTVPQMDRIEDLICAMDPLIKGLSCPIPLRVLDHAQVMKAHQYNRRINPSTGKPWFEGTMVKNLNAAWTATRSWKWMKIKEEETVEVTVTGLKEGTGKYVGMCGALICDHKGRRVRVSGMTDVQRKEFFDKPKAIIGKMIEVSFQEETEGGSLRHPRFQRVRDDKQE